MNFSSNQKLVNMGAIKNRLDSKIERNRTENEVLIYYNAEYPIFTAVHKTATIYTCLLL